MKTKLLFFAACILTGSLFAQVPEPVAHFPFDENFLDAKETVSSVAGGSVVIVADATRGNVASFPGGANADGHYITLGAEAADFNAVTYNAWFNADEVLTWSRIVTCVISTMANGVGPEFFITPANGRLAGQMSVTADFGTGPTGTLTDDPGKEVPAGTVTAGQWYMVTAAQDANRLKIWINGELKGDSAHTASTPKAAQYDLVWIGRAGWPDPLFKGKMDDLKIFNKVLSNAEVAALYTITNIESVKSEMDMIVYATKNQININNRANARINSVQVYNVTGSLVLDINDFSGSITHNLQPQLYIVKVQTNLGEHITKILIK